MSDFETITKIIQERRSIFPPMYEDRPIPDEAILAILENANWAPTHRKTEPWRFRVIKGEALAQLSSLLGDYYEYKTRDGGFSEMKYKKTVQKALKSGAVIAICMKRDPDESIPEWEEVAATACAVQNMWLTCTSMGIGSYWSSPKKYEPFNKFLKLGDGESCLGFFYMGYKKDVEFSSKREDISTKTIWL